MREIPAVFSEDFIENRESMKKIFALMLVCILVVFMYSCKDTGNDSDVNSPADDVENQNPTDSKLYFWNRAGKGCGALIPQPKHEYEILRSTDDLYAEVHNITEDDFYAYAMECVQRGFEGEVKSAEMPDLYLRAYNANGYFIELRYEREDAEFSIFVNPPDSN